MTRWMYYGQSLSKHRLQITLRLYEYRLLNYSLIVVQFLSLWWLDNCWTLTLTQAITPCNVVRQVGSACLCWRKWECRVQCWAPQSVPWRFHWDVCFVPAVPPSPPDNLDNACDSTSCSVVRFGSDSPLRSAENTRLLYYYTILYCTTLFLTESRERVRQCVVLILETKRLWLLLVIERVRALMG